MVPWKLPCFLTAVLPVPSVVIGYASPVMVHCALGAAVFGQVVDPPVASPDGMVETRVHNADGATPSQEVDCNENGSPDDKDLRAGTSDDCNWNWIPDECEPDDDCNENGIQDICDLYNRTSSDCNGSGIPDECEPALGRFFSVAANALNGAYGYGWFGGGPEFHCGDYAFEQEFALVRAAWLRIRIGFPGVSGCDGYLDGHDGLYGCSLVSEDELCVPLLPSAENLDGTGKAGLHAHSPVYDVPTYVSEATLWFDAIPLPSPTDLPGFELFHACLGGASVTPSEACRMFDYDRDSDVDLTDVGIFVRAFSGS